MALIKEYETRFKFKAAYWKVGSFSIDTNLQDVSFAFNLYMDQSSAKEKNTFLETIFVTDLVANDDKTLYNEYFAEDQGKTYKDWQTACYEYAKKHIPLFVDAVDDQEELEYQKEVLPLKADQKNER